MPNITSHTSLLFLRRQLGPINLHAIPQRHPQLGLFLRRHALPPLLDIRQRRVADGRGGRGGSSETETDSLASRGQTAAAAGN
jgi:hypothetical protein